MIAPDTTDRSLAGRRPAAGPGPYRFRAGAAQNHGTAASDGTTAAMAAARIAGSAATPAPGPNGAEHTRGVITLGHDAELVVLTRAPFTLTRAPGRSPESAPASPWSLARSSTR